MRSAFGSCIQVAFYGTTAGYYCSSQKTLLVIFNFTPNYLSSQWVMVKIFSYQSTFLLPQYLHKHVIFFLSSCIYNFTHLLNRPYLSSINTGAFCFHSPSSYIFLLNKQTPLLPVFSLHAT